MRVRALCVHSIGALSSKMDRRRVRVAFFAIGCRRISGLSLMPMAFSKSLALIPADDTEFIRAR